MTRPETNTDNLHLRKSIKKIEQSIDELKKAKAVLVSMLPKKPVSAEKIVIQLSNGRFIDALGREVDNGS